MILLKVLLLGIITQQVSSHDYDYLLKISLEFFKSQRTGHLPDDDIPWRRSSFTADEGEDGRDLSGGYFDAGDYMK